MTDTINRLAVYGSLAPGRVNHGKLAPLEGTWVKGSIKGRLVEDGWGADLGFPGMIIDPDGDDISVDILETPSLHAHLDRLDDFEGPGYERVIANFETADGSLNAYIYVLAGKS